MGYTPSSRPHQHLRIKKLLGTSEKAMKTQIQKWPRLFEQRYVPCRLRDADESLFRHPVVECVAIFICA